MDARRRENRLRLHLLQSLAMSERALARLMLQTAEALEAHPVADRGGSEARRGANPAGLAGQPGQGAAADLRRIERRLQAISRSQEALLAGIGGIRIRHPRRSPPGPIWFPGRDAAESGTRPRTVRK
ncbi:hypothetical protein [Gorillibacterium sp. sgz500922]|uniref:hypothetical protein n=1 Tax=Gorillibacterium sp. sgz500922 TaxID=3446694 RepID=UPI003F665B61